MNNNYIFFKFWFCNISIDIFVIINIKGFVNKVYSGVNYSNENFTI